ncbi:MAG: hypothetical protein K2J15_00090, partial [Muribaculaceae bacterium]|nr:hypothetical protein [Muribaculaceae bacterium]
MRTLRDKSLAIAAAVIALILAGCGGKSAGESEKPDTPAVNAVDTVETSVGQVKDAELTSEGIAPIRIGMRIVEIQPGIENLYDSIVSQGGYESNSYYFYLNGEQRFTAYEFDPGRVSLVSADNGSVV